jgi:hypothetical protein
MKRGGEGEKWGAGAGMLGDRADIQKVRNLNRVMLQVLDAKKDMLPGTIITEILLEKPIISWLDKSLFQGRKV